MVLLLLPPPLSQSHPRRLALRSLLLPRPSPRPQLLLPMLLTRLPRAAVVALASLFARCLLGRWLCPPVCWQLLLLPSFAVPCAMLPWSQSPLPWLLPQTLSVLLLHPRRLMWTVPSLDAPNVSPRPPLRRLLLHLLVSGSVPKSVILHVSWPPSRLLLPRVLSLLPLSLPSVMCRVFPVLHG